MKMLINKRKKALLFTLLVFGIFFYITYLTPLAGDDWGYAINGMKGNPFVSAYEFYFSWSGRYFSELWGFIVAPRKWLWNIINPLLFSVIYYCLNLITNKKDKLLGCVISFLLVWYVHDYLRMETYSWIMGTTYVVPLCLSLINFSIVINRIRNNEELKKYEVVISCFLNFYIGLCMENIAGVMILANILLIGYMFFNKNNFKQYIPILIFSAVSFVILRLSPGSAYRLSENTDWLAMSFIEQITSNLNAFLEYTFYDNKYLILVLNAFIIIDLVKKKSKVIYCAILPLITSTAMLLSQKLYAITNIEVFNYINSYKDIDLCKYVSLILWIIYIVFLFIYINKCFDGLNKYILIFFLLLAGASNIVMMISPIFGSRSSLYFYYFATVITLIVVDQIGLSDKSALAIVLIGLLLSGYRIYKTVGKYRLVNSTYQDRLSKIAYYVDHPEEKDIWLPRMPIYSVHGGDIEEDDTYHMEVFKTYYGLSEDCVLHFYFEEK